MFIFKQSDITTNSIFITNSIIIINSCPNLRSQSGFGGSLHSVLLALATVSARCVGCRENLGGDKANPSLCSCLLPGGVNSTSHSRTARTCSLRRWLDTALAAAAGSGRTIRSCCPFGTSGRWPVPGPVTCVKLSSSRSAMSRGNSRCM